MKPPEIAQAAREVVVRLERAAASALVERAPRAAIAVWGWSQAIREGRAAGWSQEQIVARALELVCERWQA